MLSNGCDYKLGRSSSACCYHRTAVRDRLMPLGNTLSLSGILLVHVARALCNAPMTSAPSFRTEVQCDIVRLQAGRLDCPAIAVVSVQSAAILETPL